MQIGKIILFDPDIHKIPEYNWQKFQRCLIMESGLGSTVGDIISRADNISLYAAKNRPDDLINEINNLKLALYSGAEGINYTSMSFACLVENVDGKEYPITTDTDINNLSKIILETGITHGDVIEYVELVKKKVNTQLKNSFEVDVDISYYEKLLKYSKALADEGINEKDNEASSIIYNQLLDYNRPKNFKTNDKENILLLMDKSYQKTIFAFGENNIYNSESFSMFEFRTAIELLKERNEKFKQELANIKSK